jgi:hypothetical protein
MRPMRSVTALTFLGCLLSWAEVEALQWTAAREVRAGALDGPGILGEIFHVELSRANEILVAQTAPPTISLFDAEGRFLRDVGRPGEGPGEFRSLSRIGWMGDTLWAMDFFGARLHLFDQRLQFARTITPRVTETPADADRILPGPLMADGSILGVPLTTRPTDTEPIALLQETGELVRIVARVSTRGRTVEIRLPSGSASNIGHPWPDAPLWMNAADGQSIVIVERQAATAPSRAAFRILRIGLAGDTLVDELVSYSPKAIEQRVRDDALRALAERLSRRVDASGSAPALEEDARRRLGGQEFYPPITELITGRDGTIWLRREDTSDSVDWHVFNEAGGEIGRLLLPVELRVYGADAERVWGVVRDELDVPFIEVYRINK